MRCKSPIYNRYDGRTYYVDCGKCPACKEKKAMSRSYRIRANMSSDVVCLFFKLTYADEFIPYFDLSDIDVFQDGYVSVYRDNDLKRFVSHGIQKVQVKKNVFLKDYNYKLTDTQDILKLHPYTESKVGVLYYKDIQDFFKRLRKLLFNDKTLLDGQRISYFCVGEYGETNQRPHWHILLYVPISNYSLEYWKRAVCTSWYYAIDEVTTDHFEPAQNAARYVSEYVNSSSDVSSFIQNGDFRQVWHYSKGFGFSLPAFDPVQIAKQIDRGNVTYDRTVISKDGTCRTSTVLLPRYVTNRYFPKFKGFRCLSYNDLYQIASRPYSIYNYATRLALTYDDCDRIYKMFVSKRYIFAKLHLDYAFYYCRFHELRNIAINKSYYQSQVSRQDILQSYDNIKFIYNLNKRLYVLGGFSNITDNDEDLKLSCDFRSNILLDDYYAYWFFKRVKLKKISQYVQSS